MEKTILITFYGLYLVNKDEYKFDKDGYLLLENPIDDIIRQEQILSFVHVAFSSEEELDLFSKSVTEAWKIFRKKNKKNLDSLSKFDSIINDIYNLYCLNK